MQRTFRPLKSPQGAPIQAALVCLALFPAAVAQDRPWRLDQALDTPDWLTISGETRARYETLDGQFRAAGAGSDQVWALRSLALIEVEAGPATLGLELQDSRAYLDDAGTPISTTLVNPLDVLQAYALVDLDGLWGLKSGELTVGRQTLSIASQRVLERVDMANVIASFTGAYLRGETRSGDEVHAVVFAPTGRMPADRAALADNQLSGDEEQWGRIGWGLHYRAADILPDWVSGVWAEAFVYALKERDTDAVATPNRDYLQPGLRLFRAPRPGQWDVDIETSWRTGSRRQTSLSSDVRDLDVDAWMLAATLGYTTDTPWRWRFAADHYFASGDADARDGRFTQFERLFGARRSDLGNTGIHGPLTSVNIVAPGGRIEWQPSARSDHRVAYKAAFLADARDAWIDARLQDPTGASGRFIGHSIDWRSRYWLKPQSLRLELGGSVLLKGHFAKTAPNAPASDDTLFSYVQLTQIF